MTDYFGLEEKKSRIYVKKNGGKNARMELLKFPSVIARYQKRSLLRPPAVSKQHEKLKRDNLKSLVAIAESKTAKKDGQKSAGAPGLLKSDNVRLRKEIFATRTSLQ